MTARASCKTCKWRSRRTAIAVATVLGVFATYLLGGMVAFAAASETVFYTTSPTSTFGSPGSGEGQFQSPQGVAVDQATGDVYVADVSNSRVEVFDADGKYLSQFNGSETPAGSFFLPQQVAVDNSSGPTKGDVYVDDVLHDVIDVFEPNGQYLRQITGTPSATFGVVLGLAVDGTGNVWVAEEEGGNVYEFNSKGEYVTQFNTGEGRLPSGSFAVDTSDLGDYIYIRCGNRACKYGPEGARLAVFGGENQDTTAIGVDQATHHVFLDKELGIEEFGALGEPYGAPLERFGFGEPESSEEEHLQVSYGIAVNEKTGTVYASQQPANAVAIFEAQRLVPPVLGEPIPASGITRSAVTLVGALNPKHNHVNYQFEYGATSNYNTFTSLANAPQGGKEETVEQGLNGLTPGKTYHYALVATDSAGTVAGPDQTFTTSPPTPPTVTTGGASNVTLTSATLTGLIDPRGLETSYVLEFGPDAAYGTSIAGEVGANSEQIAINVPVIELAPSTTYHYRFVAVNPDGRVYGQDQIFSTPVYEHPIVLPSSEPLLGTPSITFPTITKEATKSTQSPRPAHKKRRKARGKKKRRHRARAHGREKRG